MKRKIISVLLTLSLLTGSLYGFSFSAGAVYFSEGQKLSRVITDEGIVLLKNEHVTVVIHWDEGKQTKTVDVGGN